MTRLARLIEIVRHHAIHKSVIRRSLLLLAFTVPGYVLNFALMIVATHFLEAEAFGIFYTAVSIINMMFTPAAILVLFLTRQMSRLRAEKGEEAAIAAFMSAFRTVIVYGALAALAGMVAFGLAGLVFRAESYLMIVLVVLAAYLAYPVETIRAALQGLQRFFWLGCVGLVWMALRFALALGGLAAFGIPSAGVLGFSVASLIICIFFYPYVAGGARWSGAPLVRVDLKSVFPLVAGFLVFSGWIYADVLAGYIFLDSVALGIYSGSSILPKAAILLCMPIAQVLYPVLAEQHAAEKNKGLLNLAKGLCMTFGMSGAFAAVVVFLSPWICGGAYSIQSCAPDVLKPLMIAAIPICMLRVLVMYQLSRHKDLGPLTLAVPALAYVGFLAVQGSGATDIGAFTKTFSLFSWGAFVFYALQTLVMSFSARRS